MGRIPITAFAFLGGALAIGIGFGTQNIIKNLISGAIILVERKIRVGDIVTIGGVSGTVQTVDLRATTVRGFDGIDAIVPNSSLLENQISNWSGSSPDVRRSVVVGVSYGSDVRRAAQLVTDCALAHASVLWAAGARGAVRGLCQRQPHPAPDLLDAAGWGNAAGPAWTATCAFAIADAPQAAGIGIAFPQRDVHLDVPAAIRVELAGGSGGSPALVTPPPTSR
ncbi:MAG: mechanosensitive ion channel [Betaproteobacteria bacterium]|nr:mechanosensitive ion channel [Betaproteobacteria bacterium]